MAGAHLNGLVAVEASNGLPTHGDGFSGEWDDMQGQLDQGSGVAALTFEEYRSTGFKMFFFRHEFSHQWNVTQVRFHVHVIPMSTWAPGVAHKDLYWQVRYAWADDDVALPAPSAWTSTNVTTQLVPTDQFKPKFCHLLTINAAASSEESSFLLVEAIHLGTSINDTYDDNKATPPGTPAANVALLGFDVHYQKNKPGTVNELPP